MCLSMHCVHNLCGPALGTATCLYKQGQFGGDTSSFLVKSRQAPMLLSVLYCEDIVG